MKYLFYLGHPAHYHLFKLVINDLRSKNHDVQIYIKSKDILETLLLNENIEFINLLPEGRGNSKADILIALLKRDIRLAKRLFSNKPDMLIGTEPALAHVGWLYKIPSLIFIEDDLSIIHQFAKITFPFTRHIIAPVSCNLGKWSSKKVAYHGYQKLAYLHPNYFQADQTKLSPIQLNKPFFLIRSSKLTAYHDSGIKGLNAQLLDKIIATLKPHGQVFISSEGELAAKYQPYQLKIHPNDIHHFLFYAELLISDSQSMSVEAAMLGTPSIRFSDFSGRIGVLEELEHRFGLTFGIKTSEESKLMQTISEVLSTPNLKEEWKKRRAKMLSEKIDVTKFFIWLIEKFPESLKEYRHNPEIQWSFK